MNQYEWVLARYASNSKSGQYCLSLAENDLGYYHMNKDRTKNDDIIVAFKRPVTYDKPFPVHLTKASSYQVDKLEKLDKRRMGVGNREES